MFKQEMLVCKNHFPSMYSKHLDQNIMDTKQLLCEQTVKSNTGENFNISRNS